MKVIAYRAINMAAGASQVLPSLGLGAFICKTSGTMTITDGKGSVLVNGIAVTGGQRLELTMYTEQGCTVALTTAAGTILYW